MSVALVRRHQNQRRLDVLAQCKLVLIKSPSPTPIPSVLSDGTGLGQVTSNALWGKKIRRQHLRILQATEIKGTVHKRTPQQRTRSPFHSNGSAAAFPSVDEAWVGVRPPTIQSNRGISELGNPIGSWMLRRLWLFVNPYL